MELLLESNLSKKTLRSDNDVTIPIEKIISTIGRDFNKSVANIKGLISLLDNISVSDPDFKQIHHYLSAEALKLQYMVRDICCQENAAI